MAIKRTNRPIVQREGGNTIFGEGGDGSATFDGTATVISLAPTSNVYKLVKDIYCTDLTVNSGITLFTNGFRIFVNGTFTNNGTVGMPAAVTHSVADGSGTIAGRQNALNPSKAWGTSTDPISVTDLYDLDDAMSGFFITGAGVVTKIAGGSLGTAGSNGTTTAATGPFAGGAGSYPGANVGQAGGAGNAGTAGNPATAGTGGAGGLGGGLVIIFAKTIAGSGTLVSYGVSGSAGNPATQGTTGPAGNPAPTIPAGHTSGSFPHPANGTRFPGANSNANPASHNAGAHPHPAGSTPHPAGHHPHTDGHLPAHPHNAVKHIAAGHYPASNTTQHAPHGTNSQANNAAGYGHGSYILYVLGHNGGAHHNAGNGHHYHGVNGPGVSPHNSTSNAAHGPHPSGNSSVLNFSNHNSGPANNKGLYNAAHGHHAGNHNAGNHQYSHGSGQFPGSGRADHHNGHISVNPGHGHHHTEAGHHPATNAGNPGVPHLGNALGHSGATHHHAGHHPHPAGSTPHPAGSTPHPAGSTGTFPHSANPIAAGHNAGNYPHTASTINLNAAPHLTSNKTSIPSHTATDTPSYAGGAGGAIGAAGTANPGATGATGSTGGIIVVTRNAGNVAGQIGHSNYSKVIDI